MTYRTTSDMRLRGSLPNWASEETVLSLASKMLEDRQFYGVKAVELRKDREVLTQWSDTLVLSYRFTEISREIPTDTFEGMVIALETWINRNGPLGEAIKTVDSCLPCVACMDDVPFCVACDGKGYDRKHRDGRPTPRPLLWHRTKANGKISMSDGHMIWGKAEILLESPPCAGFSAPIGDP